MKIRNKFLFRQLLIASLFFIGIPGLISSCGGGDSDTPTPSTINCELGSSKIGECKI